MDYLSNNSQVENQINYARVNQIICVKMYANI